MVLLFLASPLALFFGFMLHTSFSTADLGSSLGLAVENEVYTNSIKINWYFVLHKRLNLMKTIKNFLFFISAFFALFSLADCADCQAYKTQVVSDCNALDSSLQSVANNVNSASGFATSGYNYATDANDKAIFSTIISTLSNTQGYIDSVSSFVSSIRSTAQSLQCNASSNTVGSCDCAQYLQTLIGLVQTCNQSVTGIATGIDSVKATLGEYNEGDDLMTVYGAVNDILNYGIYTYALLENFFEYSLQDGTPYTISDFYDSFSSLVGAVTNRYIIVNSTNSQALNYSYRKMGSGLTSSVVNLSTLTYLQNANSINRISIKDLIWYANHTLLNSLASLNNYAYSNTFAIATIVRKMDNLTNTVDISSITNLLEEKFTIFNPSPPLSMYTDEQTDGSYHDYLTNYYIKVSKGQQSGSDQFTNWFSRVELLLAALVFQDEDDSTINTNGVPSESEKNSVAEIGSSLEQTISGFVQDGNSHVSVVDTSGKSIIRMISSWNTAIGQTAKPAPFVVAEFTAPDSQSRSNISLWLDTEDEKLSSLIEIGHGISTLAWVSLFLLLGYNLAVFSIRALRKLISFSFSLYSAIFGGG